MRYPFVDVALTDVEERYLVRRFFEVSERFRLVEGNTGSEFLSGFNFCLLALAHLFTGVGNFYAVRFLVVAVIVVWLSRRFLALDNDAFLQFVWRGKTGIALPEWFAVQPLPERVSNELGHACLLALGGMVFEGDDHRLVVSHEGGIIDCHKNVP